MEAKEFHSVDKKGRAEIDISAGFVEIGPSPSYTAIYKITGVKIANPPNAQIFFQTRAAENSEDDQYLQFPDVWAVRTVAVSNDHIIVRIRRLDQGKDWGLRLRLDVLIIE